MTVRAETGHLSVDRRCKSKLTTVADQLETNAMNELKGNKL